MHRANKTCRRGPSRALTEDWGSAPGAWAPSDIRCCRNRTQWGPAATRDHLRRPQLLTNTPTWRRREASPVAIVRIFCGCTTPFVPSLSVSKIRCAKCARGPCAGLWTPLPVAVRPSWPYPSALRLRGTRHSALGASPGTTEDWHGATPAADRIRCRVSSQLQCVAGERTAGPSAPIFKWPSGPPDATPPLAGQETATQFYWTHGGTIASQLHLFSRASGARMCNQIVGNFMAKSNCRKAMPKFFLNSSKTWVSFFLIN